MKSYTTLRNFIGTMAQNTKSTTLQLFDQQMNDTNRYLMQKYYSNENSRTTPTVAQQQFYDLPSNYSKMKTVTVTIGNLKWTPKEILTRREWDELNVFPYYSDIPNNYFIWNGQVGIWPIPSSAGNTITMNYKTRVPDLALADYTTGTVTLTNNSKTVTGAGTSWLTAFLPAAGSTSNLNLWLKANAPLGDGNWYQVASITNGTTLTLVQAYQGVTSALVTYTIGQMPLLPEDFHDLLAYRPLELYFATIQPDANKHNEFKALYQEGIKSMDDYFGSKSVNVNLADSPPSLNPNLFWQA